MNDSFYRVRRSGREPDPFQDARRTAYKLGANAAIAGHPADGPSYDDWTAILIELGADDDGDLTPEERDALESMWRTGYQWIQTSERTGGMNPRSRVRLYRRLLHKAKAELRRTAADAPVRQLGVFWIIDGEEDAVAQELGADLSTGGPEVYGRRPVLRPVEGSPGSTGAVLAQPSGGDKPTQRPIYRWELVRSTEG